MLLQNGFPPLKEKNIKAVDSLYFSASFSSEKKKKKQLSKTIKDKM